MVLAYWRFQLKKGFKLDKLPNIIMTDVYCRYWLIWKLESCSLLEINANNVCMWIFCVYKNINQYTDIRISFTLH